MIEAGLMDEDGFDDVERDSKDGAKCPMNTLGTAAWQLPSSLELSSIIWEKMVALGRVRTAFRL